LNELADDEEGRTTLAALINEWLSTLSAAIAAGVPPKHFVDVVAGQSLTISESQSARVGTGVTWVRHDVGESHFMGIPEIPVTCASGWVPLSSRTWITASADSSLEPAPTAQLLENRTLWTALHAFHELTTRCLDRAKEETHRAEREQIGKKREIDRQAMDRAVHVLAATMDSESEETSVVSEEADALLSACRLVAQEQGIEIVNPGASVDLGRRADPLNAIARASRVRTRRVALRGAWWKRDNGPLLAFLEKDSEPVALLPAPGHSYVLVNPVTGVRTQVTPQVDQTISSFAFVLYRPFPDRVLTAVGLLKFGIQASSMHDVTTMLTMAVTVGLLALVTPIATGIVFDTIIPSAERNQLLQLTAILAVMAVGSALFQLTRGIAVLRIETKMGAAVQAGVWDRLLRLPAPFFRQYLAGDLARRSLGIDQIRRMLTGATFSSLLGGIFSVFSFALLFYYSGRLALVALVLVLVAATVTVLTGVRVLKLERTQQQISGKIEGLVLQFITGVSKLRVAGAEARAFEVWARDFAEQKRVAFKAGSIQNGLMVFNSVFPVIASMFIFGVLVLALSNPADAGGGAISTGSFLAFNAAFGQFLSSSLQMSSVVVSLLMIVPLYERAKPILESSPEVDRTRAEPGELSGEIELSHVSFRYDESGPLILEDVSLEALPGEFVAIVGPSGAGKSTLLRLLLGFETPESGSVYYDHQDLTTMDVQSVRKQTGVVLQNAQVLPGSIFDNIVGSSRYTIDDATEAAKMAGLDRDIQQMPMGMHTFIMEGGGTLSGGQRQRLLIARAVVSKPRILMFDEATSALDNRTQAQVSDSLENLQATRIIIAHRLSTIVNADRIYVMDRGKVVEQGTYQELLERGGLFTDLAERQIA
jgi:ATP-binding cassette subfamily C protein